MDHPDAQVFEISTKDTCIGDNGDDNEAARGKKISSRAEKLMMAKLMMIMTLIIP